MGIFFQKLFAQLLFWLYDFIDAIFATFQVLVGIDPVYIDGGEASLIDVFLSHSTVTQVFLSIFLLSIIVVAICAIAKVVTNMVNIKGGERKSHAKTVGQAFGAVITSLVMAVVMISFIFVGNSMLQGVQKSFGSDYENLSFSERLFSLSVESSYQYDYDQATYVPTPVLDANGNEIVVRDEAGLPVLDENGKEVIEYQRDNNGNIIYEAVYGVKVDKNGNPLLFSGWQEKVPGSANTDPVYYNAADLNFATMKPNDVFGVHGKTLGLFENEDKPYIKEAIVDLQSFNMWTAYLVVVVMLVVIIMAMLGLVKRIFDLTFLFLALPLVSATIPLDDGAKFKTWRDTVISKVVMAFGIVFSINIFLLMFPIIDSINFVGLGWSTTVTTVFKIFLLLGGALAINGGQLLAARLVGADASESREMAQSARALLGGAMAAGGLARGAKNLAVGGQNKYGRRVRGVLPTAAKFGGGAANLAGNVLGGSAYRGAANKTKAAVGGVVNALRGLTKTSPQGSAGNSKYAGSNRTGNSGNKSGKFNNGVIGAINKGIDNKQTKTPMGSNLFAPFNKNTGATASTPNNQQSSAQSSEKPNKTTGVSDMIGKMSVLPGKENNSGAMKKSPKK